MRDEIRYLKTLQRAANHTSFGKYKMVAGVWRGRHHIGWGENLYRNRRGGETLHASFAGKGIHAELAALSSLDCRRATLYIAGISKTGFEITSLPCPRCASLIANSSLSYVVFSFRGEIIKLRPEELLEFRR